RVPVSESIRKQLLGHVLESNSAGESLECMGSDGGTVGRRGRWIRSAVLQCIADVHPGRCAFEEQSSALFIEEIQQEKLVLKFICLSPDRDGQLTLKSLGYFN